MGQLLRAVLETDYDKVNTKEGPGNAKSIAITYPKSQGMLKQTQLWANNHQNDEIKPRSSRVVIMKMNPGTQGRRLTIQHGSNDHECFGRRNAFCS